MQRKARPELPAGSPPGAEVRRAFEVPVGAWIAPLSESMNPGAWRPTVHRAVTREYALFSHEESAHGKAANATKFPHGVWVAWCLNRPVFPAPEAVRP